MIIRPGDIEKDALVIMEGAKDFASRSVVSPMLGDGFVEIVSNIVTLPDVEILLAEHNGRAVGGIAVLYVPYIWNPDVLTAEELFWWTIKEAPFGTGRDLINKIMLNIDERGAKPMFRSLISKRKGFYNTFKRFGMEPVETLHTRIN